jgi:ribonuclease HI
MKHAIKIFTDGACRGNPGPGGWGALIRCGKHEKKIHGAEAYTTNNRMELSAAIFALKTLNRPCDVELYTDSQYVQMGISKWIHAWKKRGFKTANNQPIKNQELWLALDEETSRHQVKWHWVKGHSGHPENDLADALANHAIDELLRK